MPPDEDVIIKVCGVDELSQHLPWATHVVSIFTPDMRDELPMIRHAASRILALDFDDIDEPRILDHGEYGKQYPPTKKQIQQLIRFIRGIEAPAKLLVHCHAGISRSTAAALVAICINHELETSARWMEMLLAIRPEAFPNALMLKYADELLGLGGKLKKVGPLIQKRVWKNHPPATLDEL